MGPRSDLITNDDVARCSLGTGCAAFNSMRYNQNGWKWDDGHTAGMCYHDQCGRPPKQETTMAKNPMTNAEAPLRAKDINAAKKAKKERRAAIERRELTIISSLSKIEEVLNNSRRGVGSLSEEMHALTGHITQNGLITEAAVVRIEELLGAINDHHKLLQSSVAQPRRQPKIMPVDSSHFTIEQGSQARDLAESLYRIPGGYIPASKLNLIADILRTVATRFDNNGKTPPVSDLLGDRISAEDAAWAPHLRSLVLNDDVSFLEGQQRDAIARILNAVGLWHKEKS